MTKFKQLIDNDGRGSRDVVNGLKGRWVTMRGSPVFIPDKQSAAPIGPKRLVKQLESQPVTDILQSLVEIALPGTPQPRKRLKALKQWSPSHGTAVLAGLGSVTRSAIMDVFEREMPRGLHLAKSAKELAMLAVAEYSRAQADTSYSMDKFMSLTGLTQLQMDQIAMAAMAAGWDMYSDKWL